MGAMKLLGERKGQTEMIGLVILVVLIVIGGLFYVKFGVLGNAPERDTSLDFQRATFVAGALGKVSVCGNISLQEAVALCDDNSDACGENACTFIKKEIPKIIQAALGGEYDVGRNGTEGKKFSFYAMRKDVAVVKVGECPGKSGVVGSYPFKSKMTGKDYMITYRLC